MLYDTLQNRATLLCAENYVRTLVLRAYNCVDHNKNRFTLCYIVWREIIRFNDTVLLLFMVAGHIKKCSTALFAT